MQEARRQLDVNFFGLAMLTKEILPLMRENKSGVIINMSSIAGKLYGPLSSWYNTSKHALEGWSDCLRLEMAPFNVKVSVIEPGFIKTDIDEVSFPAYIENTKGTVYEKLGKKVYEESMKNVNQGYHASVIANFVTHATESGSPKRRYVGGYLASPLLFMRNWLGDAFMDFAMLSVLKTD